MISTHHGSFRPNLYCHLQRGEERRRVDIIRPVFLTIHGGIEEQWREME